MPVELVTIKGVPIAKEGDWPVARGYGRFTAQDLTSMAQKSAAHAPRLKIGHGSKGLGAVPAWGQATNLHVGEDADGLPTLYCDYVNVPRKLADAMPSAFPGRSIEAIRAKHGMEATAVALLGAERPAMDLGDHATLDGLHSVLVQESDLVIHAAAIVAEMSPELVWDTLGADVDSRGDETRPEAAPVPDDTNKPTETTVETPAAPAPAVTTPAPTEAPATTPEDNPAPAEAATQTSGPKLVQVDETVLTAMQARIDQLEAREGDRIAASRSTLLDECIADRRITEESRDAWDALLDRDPDGAATKLNALPKWNGGPIHAERGHQGEPGTIDTDDFDKAYNAHYGRTAAKEA